MRSIGDRFHLVLMTLYGGAAYVVGFLVTYAWLGGQATSMGDGMRATVRYGGGESAVASQPTMATLLGDGGGTASTWAGWLFYNAHFVPFSVDVVDLPASGAVTVPNVVLAADSPVVWLLFAVPPLLLTGAGALAARGAPSGRGLLRAGTRRGMTVVVGYLPLTVAGAFIFVTSPSIWRRGAVGPDPLASVMLMGLIYPVLFGGLGGWLTTRTVSSPSGTASGEPGAPSE